MGKIIKEQRFERVVEWKEEPDYFPLIISTLCVLSGLIGLYSIQYITQGFVGFCVYFNSIIVMIVSGFVFEQNKGKGKKVYWKRLR